MVRRLALALCACTLIASIAVACGDDDAAPPSDGGENPATPGKASSTSDARSEPMLTMPASRFAISVDDMGTDPSTGNAAYMTDLKATYVLDAASYGKTSIFPSPAEGEKTLKQWGYLGGYETGLIPEGRDTAVLNGAFYVNVEVHLFSSVDGAKKAFDHFESRLRDSGRGQFVPSQGVGSKSSTWTLTEGYVGTSTVGRVYHQTVFRRGNLVAVVLTSGAEGFMKVDTARTMAGIIDQKALGQKQAVEPTPIAKASGQ
ncbi:MAG: hypothetical protein HUU14_08105 [Dehalococcoidia bacterium]|nr:hypothetical protein [Dehalococcoidia bacterium]MCL4231480.1 hypothetical protein [Dehalococcoidia bacterium]NUQ55834.1 hypothetical protein [Dehalococcoidia bacterium]RIL03700.1 MAG: hypothetical protein DCC78_02815 [bacterium]